MYAHAEKVVTVSVILHFHI